MDPVAVAGESDLFGGLYQGSKRRTRSLLALLAAHVSTPMSRDVILDALWPEADPAAAINSLNQTLFQLRRVIDSSYRDGQSPQYVLSTAEPK